VVGFSLFGDLMWMRGEVEPASGEAYAATRMPPLQGTLGIRYDNPSDTWGVEIYGLFATAQDRLSPEDKKDLRICESSTTPGDLRQNCSSFDGWFTMGLRGHYSFDFGLDVVASVDNLLDQNYRVLGSGFDAPGINARVGLNYRY
jgi:outer membrane receptor protein involved in Fe transport